MLFIRDFTRSFQFYYTTANTKKYDQEPFNPTQQVSDATTLRRLHVASAMFLVPASWGGWGDAHTLLVKVSSLRHRRRKQLSSLYIAEENQYRL